MVYEVYGAAGAAPGFVRRVASTPHGSIWTPSHDEMLEARVLTRRSFGGETAVIATQLPTREALAAGFRQVPMFEALHARYPTKFDEVIEAAWEMVQARRSDAELGTAARGRLSQFALTLLPFADDATLIEFFLVVEEEATALRKLDPEACIEYVYPSGRAVNISAMLPRAMVQRELEVMRRLIALSARENAVAFDERETARLFAVMSSRVAEKDLVAVAEGAASTGKGAFTVPSTSRSIGPCV